MAESLDKQIKRPFTILSIDGGGIRGIVPARLLAELEQELKRDNPNFKLYEKFDLICGTSTGAILAIGISLGIPASELADFYIKYAKEIFPRWYLKIIPQFSRVLATSFYSNKILRKKLEEIYKKSNGGITPLMRDLKTKICVPAFNGNAGEINVFKTNHHTDYTRDFKIPAHEVALSSASAPVYFPPHSFTYSNEHGSGTNVNMIDGGIFANNPALIGILEATDKLNKNFSDIKVLSLGTGKGKHIIKTSWLPKNFWYWFGLKPRFAEITLDCQSQITEQYVAFIQRSLAKNGETFDYLRIQHEFGKDTIDLNVSKKKDLQRLEAVADELAKKNISTIKKFLNQ